MIDYRLLEIIAVTLPKVYRLELVLGIGLRILSDVLCDVLSGGFRPGSSGGV